MLYCLEYSLYSRGATALGCDIALCADIHRFIRIDLRQMAQVSCLAAGHDACDPRIVPRAPCPAKDRKFEMFISLISDPI